MGETKRKRTRVLLRDFHFEYYPGCGEYRLIYEPKDHPHD